jgi:hypothetical protein
MFEQTVLDPKDRLDGKIMRRNLIRTNPDKTEPAVEHGKIRPVENVDRTGSLRDETFQDISRYALMTTSGIHGNGRDFVRTAGTMLDLGASDDFIIPALRDGKLTPFQRF